METYKLTAAVTVFGRRVSSFPVGIGEAFEELLNKLPGGFSRSYYGIAYMENNEPFYYATAEETSPQEALKYGYEAFSIAKGTYLAVMVSDWKQKTGSIKDVFAEMMKDNRYDKHSPCIEWYKNDNEMFCMLKTNEYVTEK